MHDGVIRNQYDARSAWAGQDPCRVSARTAEARLLPHLPCFSRSLYCSVFRFLETTMAIEAKPGQTLRVTISKNVNRAGARKTLERLFMLDKAVSKPIATRSRNFKELPKRRGGQIWTKRPNKVHPDLNR